MTPTTSTQVLDTVARVCFNLGMAANTVTAQKIGSILRKAGFEKYTKPKTRYTHNGQPVQTVSTGSGVECERYLDGIVRVNVHYYNRRKAQAVQAQIEQVLTEAGYKVSKDPGLGILVEAKEA